MNTFRKIFYIYASWALIGQVSAFFYADDFNIRAFINVNLIELLFGIFLFYYLFKTESNWKPWVKNVIGGLVYAFLIILFFHLLFSVV